jgi:hypothetical protein
MTGILVTSEESRTWPDYGQQDFSAAMTATAKKLDGPDRVGTFAAADGSVKFGMDQHSSPDMMLGYLHAEDPLTESRPFHSLRIRT